MIFIENFAQNFSSQNVQGAEPGPKNRSRGKRDFFDWMDSGKSISEKSLSIPIPKHESDDDELGLSPEATMKLEVTFCTYFFQFSIFQAEDLHFEQLWKKMAPGLPQWLMTVVREGEISSKFHRNSLTFFRVHSFQKSKTATAERKVDRATSCSVRRVHFSGKNDCASCKKDEIKEACLRTFEIRSAKKKCATAFRKIL